MYSILDVGEAKTFLSGNWQESIIWSALISVQSASNLMSRDGDHLNNPINFTPL